ncbi:MAG: TetR/AcrR family transcriptional regulator [Anaerolineales bacterium]|nr:TetR/AcrR family transcriptional regulator [Anaerolineales bacterium]
MPKDTFFNLPAEKRQNIESVAIDEFAAYGYEASSINRIVESAGIAKGSFYQYFEDKADLYKHLINCIGEQKLKYISPVMQNPSDQDFFTLLGEIYRVGLDFAQDNPKASKVGFEVYKNQANPVFQEIYQEAMVGGIAYYGSLLDLAISRGEVDPEIDKMFISYILVRLQVASFDYYFTQVIEGGGDPTKWAEDILPTVKKMINFIKGGIQSQRQGLSSND